MMGIKINRSFKMSLMITGGMAVTWIVQIIFFSSTMFNGHHSFFADLFGVVGGLVAGFISCYWLMEWGSKKAQVKK